MNEITDFIARAPKKWRFNGIEMLNFSKMRRKWLQELYRGTIDEKINRRGGVCLFVPPPYARWRGVRASIMRHYRQEFKKTKQRWAYKHLCRADD
jgi:hypothetical protein